MSTHTLDEIDTIVTGDHVEAYRRDGFVRVRGLFERRDALAWGQAALAYARSHRDVSGVASIFSQHVNAWRDDEAVAALTRNPRVGLAAERLAGAPLRLWHDQVLIKAPRKSAATEFHQDQPYWPHADSPNPISMWIALVDVPVERGCMTFIPGSHRRTDLPRQVLSDAESLFSYCEDLRWEPRVTLPLRAGDCTFHHGRCAHMATPNQTDEPRVAHVVIFMDATTVYTGAPHIVTDPLGLKPGAGFPDTVFPPVQPVAAGAAKEGEA